MEAYSFALWALWFRAFAVGWMAHSLGAPRKHTIWGRGRAWGGAEMSDIGNIVNWREEARRIDSLVASIARELGWNLPDADLIEFGARVYREAISRTGRAASQEGTE
jgi:hypothetical protein